MRSCLAPCQRLHRLGESCQGVLAEGLLQTDHVRLQSAREEVLLHDEEQLIIVDDRTGASAQTVLVPSGLLQLGVPGEAQGLGETDDG